MKTVTFIKLLLTLLYCQLGSAEISVTQLYCENRVNPIGIDQVNPHLTWMMHSSDFNKSQSAYQIQVSSDQDDFSDPIWDSQKKYTKQSVRLPYEGPELKSLKIYFWRVKVWDEDNEESEWSPIAYWQMGILSPSEWKAKWITDGSQKKEDEQSRLFLKKLNLNKEVESATLVITSRGMYEAHINGKRVGEDYFTPGWTSYDTRLQYRVYNVSNLLKTGHNAIRVHLGKGWYRSNIGWKNNKDIYGEVSAILAQLRVHYKDGSSEEIITDSSWKTHESDVLFSEIYHGEIADHRLAIKGWEDENYDDSQWRKTKELNYNHENLIATYNEPVRKRETFQPKEVINTPEGDLVLDYGQNLVGFVEVDVKGMAGDSLIIEHAEVLDKNGNFYTDNLRAAKQRNIYILSGEEEEHFEPNFTWQGFRYIRIRGNLSNLDYNKFKAVALYSDMRKTGEFKCSNALLNQLQHNIQWGQRGNFLEVPTDCPQRDERLGWTGDAQVFFETAAYNYHVDNFFVKWLQDLAADQFDDGRIPHVVPNVLGKDSGGSAGWADAGTIIPWQLYQIYGNKRVLENQYESMKSWVNFMQEVSNDYLWNTGFHFGDWLFYSKEDDNDGRSAVTDKYLIAQCFFAYSTQNLIHCAKVLRKEDDVLKYQQLLRNIKEAFQREYITPNGRLVSSTQTAYVLALKFDMFPENLIEQAAQRLVDNIKQYDYHLTTGFLGTPHLCAVLSEHGFHHLAYTLLMQQTYPSWLYPVTQGATTIWERWDGQKPDGSFQMASMNSFNHYAYGAIGNWMYQHLAGIQNGGIGYDKIILRPNFNNQYLSESVADQNNGEELMHVNAELLTYYGTIKSHWVREGNKVLYDIEIPVNTSAKVVLQGKSASDILVNDMQPSVSPNVEVVVDGNDKVEVELGSGKYKFVVN